MAHFDDRVACRQVAALISAPLAKRFQVALAVDTMKPNERTTAGGGHPQRKSARGFLALQDRAGEVVQLVGFLFSLIFACGAQSRNRQFGEDLFANVWHVT